MKEYLQLTALILRHGTLHHGGPDFNELRAESLQNLQEFVPEKSLQKRQLSQEKKSSGKTLVEQIAYIKSSFANPGGHLSNQHIAYIRIPKAANTSMSHAVLNKLYPQLKAKNPDDAQINFLADVNLQLATEAGKETFFIVARNPFNRLVSVYRDFFESTHPEFLYKNYLFGILPRSISFSEFVNRIACIPDRLKDQHFKPQYIFLKPYEDNGFQVNVFKLEEGQDLKRFLSENDLEWTHRNKSIDSYDYSTYYDRQSLDKAYHIYKADIKKFGYQAVYEQLKQHF